jgi:hypothetical protein
VLIAYVLGRWQLYRQDRIQAHAAGRLAAAAQVSFG